MFTLNPSLPALICLSLLLLFIIVQLVYPFAYYLKLIKHPKQVLLEQNWQAVSIIVCARSEFQNLQTLIPALLALDYPEFEVIIVDDASWDGSTRYLEELQKTEPRLKAVFITEDMKKQYVGKKLALSLGLKAAKNEIILLCDADCLPASNQWIKYMVQAYHTNPNIEIVLGYSPFNKSPNFINLVARMENTYTGLSYFSYALNGDPYMGVGRNLSYKRALFFKNKGFASHLHIAPGDDDLFINEVANNSNTAICCHPDAFVMTNAKLSFGEWFQQKKRHNFAGKYYKKSHQLKLGFFAFSHAMLWFALFSNLIFLNSFGWALSMLGLYWLIKWPLMFYGFKKLKQTGLVVWLPIFDFLYLIYNVGFGFITLFGKQRKW
jgi:glycosyltransferase involved in cell wall biosynthesis